MPSESGITDFHAKYLAHELTRRHASDSLEKLGAVLADCPRSSSTGRFRGPGPKVVTCHRNLEGVGPIGVG